MSLLTRQWLGRLFPDAQTILCVNFVRLYVYIPLNMFVLLDHMVTLYLAS